MEHLTPKENTTKEVINLVKYNAEGNSAIVVPYEIPANNYFLTITIGIRKYYCKSSQKVEFEEGKVTAVTVTLERDRTYMSNVNVSVSTMAYCIYQKNR